jgi:thiol-disulfide isomerase/thioredoxin
VDSVVVNNDSNVLLQIPKDKESGLYTVLIYTNVNGQGVQSRFNLLFDNENIKLNTCLKTPEDSMIVINSDVNIDYFSFIKKKKYYSTYYSKLLELQEMTLQTDAFYNELKEKTGKVLTLQSKLFNQIRNDYSDNIAAKYSRWFLSSEIYANELNNIEYLRKHFLDRFDFSDSLIKNSDLLSRITAAYMFLFKDSKLTFEQQEQELLYAVDVLMTYYSVDDDIVHYVASELEKEFKSLGMEKIVIHIADNFLLPSSCSNSEAREKLQLEVDRLKQLQPGNKAPDFEIEYKRIHNLYDVKSDTVIIVFWATWCSHCQQSIPELYKMLKDNSSVKVIAIALDDNSDVWSNEIKKYPGWIHLQAKDVWDDKLVGLYAVYATPTVYVLDSDYRIINKPKSVFGIK